ncbi:unnamed protein product [marine sediment metagenome]|uniref:Uncharacterized protein n=1 Tax=marine sediment metagenome TaxID=412755 RepID=X1HHJ4_9ZZZZ
MKIEDINKIYNRFSSEQRNISRAEFIKEMQDLTCPKKMQKDLSDIELQKARYRSNKIRIDKATKNG